MYVRGDVNISEYKDSMRLEAYIYLPLLQHSTVLTDPSLCIHYSKDTGWGWLVVKTGLPTPNSLLTNTYIIPANLN